MGTLLPKMTEKTKAITEKTLVPLGAAVVICVAVGAYYAKASAFETRLTSAEARLDRQGEFMKKQGDITTEIRLNVAEIKAIVTRLENRR